jgi:hypothetical protein
VKICVAELLKIASPLTVSEASGVADVPIFPRNEVPTMLLTVEVVRAPDPVIAPVWMLPPLLSCNVVLVPALRTIVP